MSDLLSVTVGVGSVAALGLSIAKGLYEIADDMGTASQEVRIYADEIDGLVKLLLHIQTTMDETMCAVRKIADIKVQMQNIVENCFNILKPLEEIQKALSPLVQRFHNSPSKMTQVALRIRWIFSSKGKFVFYREMLNRQYKMLNSYLTAASLAFYDAADKKDPQLVNMLHQSVENSVSALNYATANPSSAREQGHIQLLLGTSLEAEPDVRPTSGDQPARPLSIRSKAPREVDTIDVVTRISLLAFNPGQGPALTALSEDERYSVLCVTRLDINDIASTRMEKMLNVTESAEAKTVQVLSDILKNGSGKTSGPQKPWKGLVASNALDRCGSNVIGRWSEMAKRVFCPNRLQFDVVFGAPVISIAPLNSIREETTPMNLGESPLSFENALIRKYVVFRRNNYSDHFVSWLILLGKIYVVVNDSLLKQADYMRSDEHGQRKARLDFENRYIICLQKKMFSWDSLPATVKSPYTTTTLRDIIVISAMLGIYWKEFNHSRSKYLAEGSGHKLVGSVIPDLGISFTYEEMFEPVFYQTRMVLNADCKGLCFGRCPTIFNSASFNILPDNGANTLQLGSLAEIAETMAGLKFTVNTVNYFRPEIVSNARHSHLFPIPFEILGMLGAVLHIECTPLSIFPNPTIYPWNVESFSTRRLLSHFASADLVEVSLGQLPSSSQHTSVQDLASNLAKELASLEDDGIPESQTVPLPDKIKTISDLHEAIFCCDKFLETCGRPLIENVLRTHFDAVLKILNGKSGDNEAGYKKLRQFDDAAFGSRHELFVEIYVSLVRPRVLQAVSDELLAEEGMELEKGSDTFSIETKDKLVTVGKINDTWCTLVFRMLCWLSLHSFDKNDIQIGQSGFYDSQEPAYIL